MIKLYEWQLNPYYDAACWEMLHQHPHAYWFDLTNTYDGCAFE